MSELLGRDRRPSTRFARSGHHSTVARSARESNGAPDRTLSGRSAGSAGCCGLPNPLMDLVEVIVTGKQPTYRQAQ
jgi:hypothetical protein